MACSARKTGMFQPSSSRVQINNFPIRGYSVPSICFQCPKASCLEACPTGAIYRSDDDVVLVNSDLCTSCSACVSACPYGMIDLDSASIAYKCDLCDGDPACVKECHADALIFAAGDAEQFRLKAAQMKYRTISGSPADKRRVLGENLMKKARS